MMNLMHWRMLVAVADIGNISKAAERLGITQSGASQAIAQLEEMLGVQLLAREQRRTIPTAVGERVITRARVMLEELNAIQTLAQEAQALQCGQVVKLASFKSVFAVLLPPLVRTFRRRYPGIDLVALEGSDEEVEAWLASDAIDIGVIMNPAPERNALPLGRDAWMAVVPNKHPFARRAGERGVTFAELVNEPFVLATGGCVVNARSLAERAGLTLRDVRVEVCDWPSAFTLVRQGMGVTLVPELILPADQQGLSILRLVPPIHREFGLLLSRAGTASRAARAFLDMVQEKQADGLAKEGVDGRIRDRCSDLSNE